MPGPPVATRPGAVMLTAATDFTALVITRAIEHVAAALEPDMVEIALARQGSTRLLTR
jgi:hypothetical protein